MILPTGFIPSKRIEKLKYYTKQQRINYEHKEYIKQHSSIIEPKLDKATLELIETKLIIQNVFNKYTSIKKDITDF